ncbi:MAG: hypothetical protein HPY51_18160 [Candidatus Omnitrophica bacterium]|nr:hypothetical protein [Candidatus Omnitrophota bacterium]
MGYIEKYSIQTEAEAIQFLKNNIRAKALLENTLEYTGDGDSPFTTIRNMLIAIKEIADHFRDSGSWELEYWLGRGFSWCGEHYSSIEHFERAYRLSEGHLDNQIPPARKKKEDLFDRNDIAYATGEACLKVGHASFISKAIEHLKKLLENCTGYHPGIARLAEAYFDAEQFMEAAAAAEEAHNRLKTDSHWSNQVDNPRAMSILLSKCYSREALRLRDLGEIPRVVEVLEQARVKGIIKPIDMDLLKRLQKQERILTTERHHLEQIITSKPVMFVIRRELKKNYPDVTFDYEAIRKELLRRMGADSQPDATPPLAVEKENGGESALKTTEELHGRGVRPEE